MLPGELSTNMQSCLSLAQTFIRRFNESPASEMIVLVYVSTVDCFIFFHSTAQCADSAKVVLHLFTYLFTLPTLAYFSNETTALGAYMSLISSSFNCFYLPVIVSFASLHVRRKAGFFKHARRGARHATHIRSVTVTVTAASGRRLARSA